MSDGLDELRAAANAQKKAGKAQPQQASLNLGEHVAGDLTEAQTQMATLGYQQTLSLLGAAYNQGAQMAVQQAVIAAQDGGKFDFGGGMPRISPRVMAALPQSVTIAAFQVESDDDLLTEE